MGGGWRREEKVREKEKLAAKEAADDERAESKAARERASLAKQQQQRGGQQSPAQQSPGSVAFEDMPAAAVLRKKIVESSSPGPNSPASKAPWSNSGPPSPPIPTLRDKLPASSRSPVFVPPLPLGGGGRQGSGGDDHDDDDGGRSEGGDHDHRSLYDISEGGIEEREGVSDSGAEEAGQMIAKLEEANRELAELRRELSSEQQKRQSQAAEVEAAAAMRDREQGAQQGVAEVLASPISMEALARNPVDAFAAFEPEPAYSHTPPPAAGCSPEPVWLQYCDRTLVSTRVCVHYGSRR